MSHNPVVWYEIPATDLMSSKRFYDQLLTIEVQVIDAPSSTPELKLGLLPGEPNSLGLCGALASHPEILASTQGSIVFFNTINLEHSLSEVHRLGGAALGPIISLAQQGTIAYCIDCQGQIFALHQHLSEHLLVQAPQINHVTWFEIPALNLHDSMNFYQQVLNCDELKIVPNNKDYAPVEDLKAAFFPMDQDSYGASGALVSHPERLPSLAGSVVYFKVSSIEQALKKVQANHGSMLFDRTSIGEYGFIAQCTDIAGGRFGLFEQSTPSADLVSL